jgi:methylated-DNA-[protein]-cysteine S-methyltransferase
MRYYFDTFTTPVGPFTVALDDDGAVVATAFGEIADLRRWFQHEPLLHAPQRAAAVGSQVKEFFAGKRERFELRFSPVGTAFQKRVWSELQRIPFGEMRSYAELAAAVGRPGAARAVGQANAANPICLLVPCHRVIAANGKLGGFAYGDKLKRRLLEHEASCGPLLAGASAEKPLIPAHQR